MEKITIEGYRCKRCDHVWIPKRYFDRNPVTCPKCKSPYWNSERAGPIGRPKKKADKG